MKIQDRANLWYKAVFIPDHRIQITEVDTTLNAT